MNVLFIGDVIGRPGRVGVRDYLQRHQNRWDLVIANGENAAGGRGLTEETARELLSAGVHGLTSGNHIWDRKEAFALLGRDRRIIRPANYAEELPGTGLMFLPSGDGRELAVINLSGRAFMGSYMDCPFQRGEALVKKASSRTPFILVDFHGEATSEKLAFLHYMDGKVSCIVGTHTHVQTADEQVTEKQTGYITDVGMTGPVDSVLGMKKDPCLERFLLSIPSRMETAEGRVRLCGISVSLDARGRTKRIERVSEMV